jgi:8-oxo-dGTP diphosphatase
VTELVFISEKNRARYLKIITPIGNFLGRIGVHPHILSISGLTLSILAGFVYGIGSFFWGAWVVVLAGICDTLDGQLARETGKDSSFGAFFDSTLDRYSDMFILMGLAWHFAGGPVFIEGKNPGNSPWAVIFIVMAMAGSYMVSYTRARAEGLGVECQIGMMQRPERITLLVIGSLLGSIPMIGPLMMKCALLILAITSNFTAIHRIYYVRNHISSENKEGSGKVVEKYRNPFPTVDVIIEMDGGVVLIRRKNPPYGWALPGESLETAAIREAKEETSLNVELISQFGAYSDPNRDPRQHNISFVFKAKATGQPQAADDAKEIGIFDRDSLPDDLAFDHGKILQDYFDR